MTTKDIDVMAEKMMREPRSDPFVFELSRLSRDRVHLGE